MRNDLFTCMSDFSKSKTLTAAMSENRFRYVDCIRRRRKIRAQAWILFARLFKIQKLEYSTSKQFLIIYTSTSSCLNFGTIVVNYFLIRQEFMQSGFKCDSDSVIVILDSACTSSLSRLFHILTILLVKRIFADHILHDFLQP